MNLSPESIVRDLREIREKKPLIHHVTNYVSAQWVANGLLALGASPVMAHAPEEVLEMLSISQALVLNIGTLDEFSVRSMKLALSEALRLKIRVILDPVGAGATSYRTRVARELLSQGGVTVLRGNPSEICALAGDQGSTKGVDSALLPREAYAAAQRLHQAFGCVVVVSGPDDLIYGSTEIGRVYNGTPMMSRVTGMGCLVSAFIAAFCAVQEDPILAATHAMAYAGITGEKAVAEASGPGSFQAAYLDNLSTLAQESISKLLTVESHAISS